MDLISICCCLLSLLIQQGIKGVFKFYKIEIRVDGATGRSFLALRQLECAKLNNAARFYAYLLRLS